LWWVRVLFPLENALAGCTVILAHAQALDATSEQLSAERGRATRAAAELEAARTEAQQAREAATAAQAAVAQTMARSTTPSRAGVRALRLDTVGGLAGWRGSRRGAGSLLRAHACLLACSAWM
jgi:hypothetical protein